MITCILCLEPGSLRTSPLFPIPAVLFTEADCQLETIRGWKDSASLSHVPWSIILATTILKVLYAATCRSPGDWASVSSNTSLGLTERRLHMQLADTALSYILLVRSDSWLHFLFHEPLYLLGSTSHKVLGIQQLILR